MALVVSALSFVPLEQSQAQLIIDVYPSQDHTNQTLWIFSGSSSSRSASAQIRDQASLNTDNQDTWQIDSNNGNIFDANKPSDTSFQLSPLLSSTNRLDTASVNARIPGGGKTNITFEVNATNTPTIGSGNGTISHLFLDEDASGIAHYDDFGIRYSGAIIPEPEEYALVFGLFALAFVFFHRRRMQKKQRRQAATL